MKRTFKAFDDDSMDFETQQLTVLERVDVKLPTQTLKAGSSSSSTRKTATR